MKIYGFSAKAEHGKTYASNVLLKELEQRGLKVRIIPLAETLKDMARSIGWTGEKDVKGRTLLQDLGKVLKAYHGGDCFARWAYDKAVNEKLDVMLIDDMRMLDEVAFFENLLKEKKVDDYKLYRIVRPGYENHLTEAQRQDISETALDNYAFDKVIINDGTSNFADILKELVKES